ncbi:ROK family protein [Treponema sp.]
MKYRAGIDLGGTKLAVGLFDTEGKLLGECVSRDHRGLSEEAVLDCVERNLESILSSIGIPGLRPANLLGAGVLFPGHIRFSDGLTLTSSNLPGFKNFPLRARLEQRLRCPVIADNDANGQTLGEHRYGAGRGVDHMVFMTVSTGVGGGIIINGQLYRGMTGTAGEFGHMIVDATGAQLCTCGNRGCLMGAASGITLPNLTRRVAEKLHVKGHPAQLPSSCEDFDDMDGEVLGSGCEDNELCQEVVKEFSHYIGIGLYNIFQMLNPRLIVLGGGLLNLPEIFFSGAKDTCYDLAGQMMLEPMAIKKGELGQRSGIYGAAALIEVEA